jgi:hypothetical protein
MYAHFSNNQQLPYLILWENINFFKLDTQQPPQETLPEHHGGPVPPTQTAGNSEDG